ncbi:hypothetical protein YTPLAS18_18750 [Nitrospira sp.]|nr:hypothetical protein YTPLAS18_18750 [Nitrospira sp.]
MTITRDEEFRRPDAGETVCQAASSPVVRFKERLMFLERVVVGLAGFPPPWTALNVKVEGLISAAMAWETNGSVITKMEMRVFIGLSHVCLSR